MINVGDKVTGSWGGTKIEGTVIETWEAKGKKWARVRLKGSSFGEAVPAGLLTKKPSRRKQHTPM